MPAIVDFSTLAASDLVLLLNFALATFLAAYFALGHPRTWVHDRLGWVIFGYAVVTVAFIGLIAYAIVFGERAIEPIRLAIGIGMAGALVAKIWAVYRERREGRIARLATTERIDPVSIPLPEPTPDDEKKADAIEIWYKGKRVLRTLVQTVIPSFIGFAVVLPLIIEALGLPVDSELRLWLLAIAGGVTAVATGIARVMAIPQVNAWLIKIGLGSVPQEAVVWNPTTGDVIAVGVDPKVARRG